MEKPESLPGDPLEEPPILAPELSDVHDFEELIEEYQREKLSSLNASYFQMLLRLIITI